jgi:AP endonuclease-2
VLYCPNEGSDARFSYKMNYHLILQERVRGLIAVGREMVVVGDLNVCQCAAPIDHSDGHVPTNAPPSGSTQREHGRGTG